MISIHEYVLRPRKPLNALTDASPRRGALLRVDGGYADIHPWPELGDLPLDEQLARLSRGVSTPLTARSLAMAGIDAAARREGRSLFAGLTMTSNHWPHAAGAPPRAFDTVKVKLGPGQSLPEGLGGFKLRLDFNGTLTRASFENFVNTLTKWNAIEFLEDPLPYDPAIWSELRARHGLPFALDRGLETAGVDVLVVKPAVQEVEPALATSLPLVITSYMDHPVGQLHAAFVAATLATQHPGRVRRSGLLTHLLYQNDAFTERLQIEGSALTAPSGTGIGFDDLLAALPWRSLT